MGPNQTEAEDDASLPAVLVPWSETAGTPPLPPAGQGRRRLLRLGLAVLLALAVVFLGGASLHRKVQSFQPLGFEWQGSRGAAAVTQVYDLRTGLETGDRILLVNGAEVAGSTAAAPFTRQLKEREESRLLVLRGSGLQEIVYHRLPLEIDVAYLILALISAAYLLIGVYTLIRQGGGPGLLFFLWCLASTAFYLFTAVPPHDLLFKLSYLGDELARLLLPALTVHLFLVFPARSRNEAPVRRWIPFLYLPAAVLLALQLDLIAFGGRFVFGRPTAASLAVLDRLELFHLIAGALIAGGILVLRLMRNPSWEEQRQLQWMACGLAGGYLPFAALYGIPWSLGVAEPRLLTAIAVVPLAAVPLTFAWAILRYKLWDIEVIVRDTVSSTLTLLLGLIGFSLVNLAIVRGVPQDFAVARNLFSFASGLGIAGLLVPTRRSISSGLERLHYRGRFGKRRALSELGRELLRERDLGRLSAVLLQQITECVGAERCNLFLNHGTGFLPVHPEPESGVGWLPADLFAPEEAREFWREDFQRLHGTVPPGRTPGGREALWLAGYRYLFPLRVLDTRVGLVAVSCKRQHQLLNSDDTQLIRQLLNQAALALENAQLLAQLRQRLDEVVQLQRYNEGIFESSPAGIAVLEGERVVTVNAAFARLAGRPRHELVGGRLRDVLPVGELPVPGGPPLETSYCEMDGEPKGRERCFQLSLADFAGSAASPPAGEPLRILVVHDVSERVAMENALREQERLAALGLLAAGVAHEVNTPITGISSYAQMLLADTPESDPHHEILKKMERQTFRAARIVNNLMELARDRNQERQPVEIVRLVSEVVDLLKDRIRKRSIEVAWELPENPAEAVVLGCDGELQQVFANLLINAVDAMSETSGGGRLTLSCEIDPATVRLRVRDNGPGIPPERREQIFQPFFSTKLHRGGTGLGLPISHEIVRRHGGTLAATSEPGEGACFTVELPRSTGSESPNAS